MTSFLDSVFAVIVVTGSFWAFVYVYYFMML
jgi:hypothetical protein